jgi:hypothetical protein
LALKVDSKEEYAVFVNENKYEGELNSIDKVFNFLNRNYLDPLIKSSIETTTGQVIIQDPDSNTQTVYRETVNNKKLKIISYKNVTIGAKVFIDERPAPDGIYTYKALTHKLIVQDGKIIKRFYLEPFKEYIFEKINECEPCIGDKVYLLNGGNSINGKLKYSLFKSFYIENGKIIK